ncbi:hypothetical protein OGY34_11955 [Citrobacter sp. Cy232]|uniref:hypothetical protein n=1 Tax=Citrobacter sp. Cy232 TaxID=2985164 RepID=UPI0025765F82|nr:hypothetical protein [Citrobacter sp. Cy232]MDM2717180.1 hypothetical protein [Citrobacter sp. Cy232]
MTALNKQARQVQRYTNYGVDMMEWDDGTYVKYSDYQALLDEMEAAEKRIAELEARTITVKFEPIPMEELGNCRDGKKHPYMFGAGYNSAVVHCESVLHQACAAAGIGVKGE